MSNARAEFFLKISFPDAPSSQLDSSEYTEHTLLVGRWDGEGKDWPPPFLSYYCCHDIQGSISAARSLNLLENSSRDLFSRSQILLDLLYLKPNTALLGSHFSPCLGLRFVTCICVYCGYEFICVYTFWIRPLFNWSFVMYVQTPLKIRLKLLKCFLSEYTIFK